MSEWFSQFHSHMILNHALLQGVIPNCSLADGLRGLGLFMVAMWGVRWGLAGIAQWRLARNAEPFPVASIPHLAELYGELAHTLRLKRLPPLLKSPANQGPAFTAGFIRQRVYLSLPLANLLSKDELTALLGHELVHVKRRDNALYALAELILAATPLWFIQFFAHNLHCDPVEYWAATGASFLLVVLGFLKGSRWFRETRERSCDDRIVSETGKPLALASALVKTWRWMQASPGGFTVPKFRHSHAAGFGVEARIRRLLNYRGTRFRLIKTILARFAFTASVCISICFLVDYHLTTNYNQKLTDCHAQAMASQIKPAFPACERLQHCQPAPAMPTQLPCHR